MSSPLVVVSNELGSSSPSSQRISDGAVRSHHPDVAICRRSSTTVETHVPIWVVLYPDGSDRAVVSTRGVFATTRQLTLEDLTALYAPERRWAA